MIEQTTETTLKMRIIKKQNDADAQTKPTPIYNQVAILTIICSLISTTKQFCGAISVLSSSATFNREPARFRNGTFDTPMNGHSHSIFGWLRISDNFYQDAGFEILRYESMANVGESKLPSVYSKLFRMSYDWNYNKQVGHFKFDVANSEDETKEFSYGFNAKSYSWIYFGFTHDSEEKKGIFFIMDASTIFKKEFKTEYVYELRQFFKIYYGAFTERSGSMGFYGDIGPLFYSNNYLSQIAYYWMGSYFKNSLVETEYVRLEYVFDDYTNINTIKDNMGEIEGKIKGDEAAYSGKSGLAIGKGTKIIVPSNQTATYGFVKTLCYFFVFQYYEELPGKYYLLKRGPVGKPFSLAIILMKSKEGYRTAHLEVGYKTKKGSPKTITFRDTRKINAELFNQLQVCFSMAQDYMSNALIYLNGKVKYFDKVNNYVFDWDANEKDLTLADNEESAFKGKGKIVFLLFNIIEGAGNAIWSQEDQSQIMNKCLNKCKLPTNNMVMSYKCMSCQKKANNVNEVQAKKCKRFCRKNHKNLNGYCFKCSESNCGEKDMPRMIITKANKYYTKFKISPSKKLQKDLNDWPKRIVNKVTDFKEGVDYEVKYTVDPENIIWMDFQSKKDFKEKNITIIVKNVKDVYDTEGNLMHDNKAVFFIKGFINYPESTKKMVKGAGVFFAGAFAGAAVVGVVANFFGSLFNLPSMTGAIIAMFEILQYLTFLLFLNTELPPACDDFISTLFENTVELGAILNEIIIKLNIKDINFAFGYDLDKEEIRYMLLLNAAIPFLIQLCIVILWITYRIMFVLCGCLSSKCKEFLRKKIQDMDYPASSIIFLNHKLLNFQTITDLDRWEGLFSMIFMFDVEMVVFGALNLWHPIKTHWAMSISYYLSIFYLSVIALSVPVVIFVANRPRHVLEHPNYRRNWGIVYEEFKLTDKQSRLFKAFSITRFLFFGLLLVFAYYIPVIQISGSFIIALGYLIALVIKRPHEEKGEFFRELITEFLFTAGNFFFFVLALDESYNIIRVDTRVSIGWFIVFIYVIALAISIMLVLIPGIKGLIKICKGKKKEEEEEDDDDVPDDEAGPPRVLRPSVEDRKETERSRLNTSQRGINHPDGGFEEAGKSMRRSAIGDGNSANKG